MFSIIRLFTNVLHRKAHNRREDPIKVLDPLIERIPKQLLLEIFKVKFKTSPTLELESHRKQLDH